MIAMISAGKSKFLNLISNINYLECKPGIGTKFVNFIRYNPKINEPHFYHLKIIKQINKYSFEKDLSYEEIIGKEKIIKANKDLNDQLKEKEVDYEDIFYMTEINETPIIKDEDYLLTHDLCDLPGLSEYQNQQSEKNESNQKKNKEKLKGNDKDFDQNQRILKNIFNSIIEDNSNISNEKVKDEGKMRKNLVKK